MTKQKSIAYLLIVFLLISAVSIAFAEAASPLPEDNLIENPWFRDASNTTASHDGWEVTAAWGLSQKVSNPTFDDVLGTSARIGTPKAAYNEDHFMSQTVAADPNQSVLLFQMWQVSRNLVTLKATVYGSDSPEGPWTEVWQPWHQQQSSVHWLQTPLFETELEQGYPYYKLELMCNYSHGIAGCKYSGVYFKVTAETGIGVAAETVESAISNNSANNSSSRINPAASDLGLEQLTAVPLSTQVIQITWPEHERVDAVYQIERSLDGRGSWELVDQVTAEAGSFEDMGLQADTEYYYRIQVNFEGGGRSRSPIFSATTLAAEVIEITPTAVVEIISQPSLTPVVEAAPPIALSETPEPALLAAIQATEAAPETAAVSTNEATMLDQAGLLLMGFGLGALVIGGLWSLSRRKTN